MRCKWEATTPGAAENEGMQRARSQLFQAALAVGRFAVWPSRRSLSSEAPSSSSKAASSKAAPSEPASSEPASSEPASSEPAPKAAPAGEPPVTPLAQHAEALATRGFQIAPVSDLGGGGKIDLASLRALIAKNRRVIEPDFNPMGDAASPCIEAVRFRARIGSDGALDPIPPSGEPGDVAWKELERQPGLKAHVEGSLEVLRGAAQRQARPISEATVILRRNAFDQKPGFEDGLRPHDDPYELSAMTLVSAKNVYSTNKVWNRAETEVLGESHPGQAAFVDHRAVKHDMHLKVAGDPAERKAREVERIVAHVAVR